MHGAFEATDAGPTEAATTRQLQFWQRPIPAVILTLAIAAVAGVGVWTVTRLGAPAPRQTTRSTILLPGTDRLSSTVASRLALSPDGSTLVYIGVRDGVTELYRRRLDQLGAVAIPETQDATAPFFSPGGEWLAFESGGVLKRVAVRGGPATTICDLPGGLRGATWPTDDTIIFGVTGSGLLQVPSAGGEPRPFLDLEEGETHHSFPWILPGGRAVLLKTARGAAPIVVHSLDTSERRVLIEEGTSPYYVPTGHLVFGRAGSLWAAPFDLDDLDLRGEPVPILEGVMMGGGGPPAQAVFASTGSLVYASGGIGRGAERTLVWVDPDGSEEVLPLPPGYYDHPRLSPEGTALAVEVRDGADVDIWVFDLERGSPSRITFGGPHLFPNWSPDGEQLVFADRIGTNRLLLAPSGGGGTIDTLLDRGEAQYPTSWTSDGHAVAFYVNHPDTDAISGCCRWTAIAHRCRFSLHQVMSALVRFA